MSGERIRVVIGDDSFLIRESLARMLERAPAIDVAAVCDNRYELERAIAAQAPDLVITDIRMPPSGEDEGIRLAERLRAERPQTGVLVLSQYAEPAYALSLLRDGTAGRGYLLKENLRDAGELTTAVADVAAGGSRIDPAIVDVLVQEQVRRGGSALAELTPRELELLALIAEGRSNTAIAETLVITKRAVEKHVNAIFSKLGLTEQESVSSRVKATLIYLAES